MNKLLSIASLLVVGAAFQLGCSSDDNNNPADTGTPGDSAVTTDTGVKQDTGTDSPTDSPKDTPSDTPSTPPPPALGTQIDRMGRPGINTAANHAFDTDATAKGNAKDSYNQDKDPTHWTSFVPEFEKNLGILDALDGTCGNQLAYKSPAAADSYSALAGLLAGDMVWLKTDGATCSLDKSPSLTDTTPGGYLAVEANALTVVPNTDCGGRALSYDVMNVTYSLVAAGAGGLAASTAHLDGITTVPARSTGKTFPYMADPH